MDQEQPHRVDPKIREALKRLTDEAERATAPMREALSKIRQAPVIDNAQLDNLRRAATLPALESMRGLGDQIARIRESMPGALAPVQTPPDAATTIQVSRPIESYIVDAQYETVDVIEKMGGLLQQSLEVQGNQVEVLEATRKAADQQTRLTRWVLGFAIAAVVVGLVGIAASVAVALLG